MMDANTLFEKYRPQFERLNARIYTAQTYEDTLLLRWWITLHETGDIHRLILPDSHRLSAFMNIFKHPTAMLYSLAPDNTIDNAAWFAPIDEVSKHRAAYGAMWCAPPCRGTHKQMDFGAFAYSLAFEVHDAILGMTWQPELIDIHLKLGYNVVGVIPHLHDKENVFIVHLTRERFMSSRFMQIAQRRT